MWFTENNWISRNAAFAEWSTASVLQMTKVWNPVWLEQIRLKFASNWIKWSVLFVSPWVRYCSLWYPHFPVPYIFATKLPGSKYIGNWKMRDTYQLLLHEFGNNNLDFILLSSQLDHQKTTWFFARLWELQASIFRRVVLETWNHTLALMSWECKVPPQTNG